MVRSTAKAMVNLPAEKMDLREVIFNMTNEEYIHCSNDHIGMGISKESGGDLTLLNIEKSGGHYFISFYKTEFAGKHGIKLVSDKTKPLSRTPSCLKNKDDSEYVSWEMSIQPDSDHKCIFTNDIHLDIPWIPSFLMKAVEKKLIQTLGLHNEEETQAFARLIEKRFQKVE